MPTPPAELMNLIVIFQPQFTNPTWENAKVLLLGALLARGNRTVTACLRVVGLGQEEHFQNYHRVLNRAKWSALDLARILLGLIILIFACATQEVIILAADDTIERRGGRSNNWVVTETRSDRVKISSSAASACGGFRWR